MRRHRLFSSLIALGLAFGAVGLTAVPAVEACAVARRMPPTPTETTTKIETAAARFLFARQADEITAHIQINYYGDAKDFSWIVPIPAEPKLSVGSDALFTSLRTATKPQFNLNWKSDEGTCKERPSSGAAGAPAASKARSPGAGAPAAAPAVDVVSQRQIGPYDSVVLKSDDPAALKTWLTENQYEIPAKLESVMADYVNAKYYFVALKLQQDRTAGDLQPIVLKYKAETAGIPVRLASVAATPDMDVQVWVLGQNRAIPENYNHTEINLARIDWMNEGENYRQVVTEAMNESGGKSFVTDYAGPSSAVRLPTFDESRYSVARLEAKTDPVDFIQTFRSIDIFEEGSVRGRTLAFLKRHVPRPVSVPSSVSDETFYANPDMHRDAFAAAAQTVDPAKAIEELNETLIKPKREINQIFADNAYLTALYTTMSPDEMVEDPTFQFNPDMEAVKNVHNADIRRQCSPNVYMSEAPYKITLENKISFLVASNGEDAPSQVIPRGGKQQKIPAAGRIMRCGTVGRPNVLTDNLSQITRTMNNLLQQGVVVHIRTSAGANPSLGAGTTVVVTIPVEEFLSNAAATGFGCAGCSQMTVPPPPIRRGAGEGLTYALAFLGFLGYRRWLGRK